MLIDELKKKTKDELAALAKDWGAEVPGGASKDELLDAICQTGEAERVNLAGNAVRMLQSQAEARGLDEDEFPALLEFVESELGSPVLELTVPELNRLARGVDGVMRSYLGGHKRKPAKRRPAGLR